MNEEMINRIKQRLVENGHWYHYAENMIMEILDDAPVLADGSLGVSTINLNEIANALDVSDWWIITGQKTEKDIKQDLLMLLGRNESWRVGEDGQAEAIYKYLQDNKLLVGNDYENTPPEVEDESDVPYEEPKPKIQSKAEIAAAHEEYINSFSDIDGRSSIGENKVRIVGRAKWQGPQSRFEDEYDDYLDRENRIRPTSQSRQHGDYDSFDDEN